VNDDIEVIASDPIYLDYKKLQIKDTEMVIEGIYDFQKIYAYLESKGLLDESSCDLIDADIDIAGAKQHFEVDCSIDEKIDELHRLYDYRNFSDEKIHAIANRFNELIGHEMKQESIKSIGPKKN